MVSPVFFSACSPGLVYLGPYVTWCTGGSRARCHEKHAMDVSAKNTQITRKINFNSWETDIWSAHSYWSQQFWPGLRPFPCTVPWLLSKSLCRYHTPWYTCLSGNFQPSQWGTLFYDPVWRLVVKIENNITMNDWLFVQCYFPGPTWVINIRAYQLV